MPWRPLVPLPLPRLLILFAVVLLAASITQCRMVTDQIVRVQAEDLSASSCIKACTKAAKQAIKEENELHKDRLEACRGDDDVRGNGAYDGGDKNDPKNPCVLAEEARHKAALKAIDAQRIDCINGCHHQGGGSGR